MDIEIEKFPFLQVSNLRTYKIRTEEDQSAVGENEATLERVYS